MQLSKIELAAAESKDLNWSLLIIVAWYWKLYF